MVLNPAAWLKDKGVFKDINFMPKGFSL